MSSKGLGEQYFIDEIFVSFLSELSSTAMETYKVSEKAGLFAWATTRDKLKDRIKLTKKKTEGGITAEGIRDLIEGEAKLVCISITDPYTLEQIGDNGDPQLLQNLAPVGLSLPHFRHFASPVICSLLLDS